MQVIYGTLDQEIFMSISKDVTLQFTCILSFSYSKYKCKKIVLEKIFIRKNEIKFPKFTLSIKTNFTCVKIYFCTVKPA